MARETLRQRQTPLVSCVMAAHNAERYVEEAIRSILEQSLRDFELIVVDDGSTDRTSSILSEYAKLDSRVCVMRQEAKGLTRSLIAATAQARGAFIARMDADDVSESKRFESQVAFLERQDDVVAVGCSLQLMDPDGEFLATRAVVCTHEQIVDELFRGNGAIPHPTAMIRRDALERVGGYREQFTASQDLDLWLRLAEIGRLANLPQPLLRYRLHEQSITTQKREVQLACAEQAVREAKQRRGDEQASSFAMPRCNQPSRSKTLRGWARMALKHNRLSVARKHAWSALCYGPLNPSHWWLLLRTLTYFRDRSGVMKRLSFRERSGGTPG